jgi:hypothetical protein
MTHDSLLIVSSKGEFIGKTLHHDGDDTFLVERGLVFPDDFEFRYESTTGVSEDGTLVYILLAEYDGEEEPAEVDAERPPPLAH